MGGHTTTVISVHLQEYLMTTADLRMLNIKSVTSKKLGVSDLLHKWVCYRTYSNKNIQCVRKTLHLFDFNLRGLAGQNNSFFQQNEHFEIFRLFKSAFNFLSNDI